MIFGKKPDKKKGLRKIQVIQHQQVFSGAKLSKDYVDAVIEFTIAWDAFEKNTIGAERIQAAIEPKIMQKLVDFMVEDRHWKCGSFEVCRAMYQNFSSSEVIHLLQNWKKPRTDREFAKIFKNNVKFRWDFEGADTFEITIEHYAPFYRAFKEYQMKFLYYYEWLEEGTDPSKIPQYRGGGPKGVSLQKMFLKPMPNEMGETIWGSFPVAEQKKCTNIKQFIHLISKVVERHHEHHLKTRERNEMLTGRTVKERYHAKQDARDHSNVKPAQNSMQFTPTEYAEDRTSGFNMVTLAETVEEVKPTLHAHFSELAKPMDRKMPPKACYAQMFYEKGCTKPPGECLMSHRTEDLIAATTNQLKMILESKYCMEVNRRTSMIAVDGTKIEIKSLGPTPASDRRNNPNYVPPTQIKPRVNNLTGGYPGDCDQYHESSEQQESSDGLGDY
jgi:hypothetical protein